MRWSCRSRDPVDVARVVEAVERGLHELHGLGERRAARPARRSARGRPRPGSGPRERLERRGDVEPAVTGRLVVAPAPMSFAECSMSVATWFGASVGSPSWARSAITTAAAAATSGAENDVPRGLRQAGSREAGRVAAQRAPRLASGLVGTWRGCRHPGAARSMSARRGWSSTARVRAVERAHADHVRERGGPGRVVLRALEGGAVSGGARRRDAALSRVVDRRVLERRVVVVPRLPRGLAARPG